MGCSARLGTHGHCVVGGRIGHSILLRWVGALLRSRGAPFIGEAFALVAFLAWPRPVQYSLALSDILTWCFEATTAETSDGN